jgi:hypothetical protein
MAARRHMDTLRRITPDEVRAACEALGATLVPRTTWLPNERCGCPLGVLAAAADPQLARSLMRLIDAARVLGVHGDYATSFAGAFDDADCFYSPGISARYDQGHADGLAVAHELTPERFAY